MISLLSCAVPAIIVIPQTFQSSETSLVAPWPSRSFFRNVTFAVRQRPPQNYDMPSPAKQIVIHEASSLKSNPNAKKGPQILCHALRGWYYCAFCTIHYGTNRNSTIRRPLSVWCSLSQHQVVPGNTNLSTPFML